MKFSKKSLACATGLALLLSTVPSYADPTIMFGLALNFGRSGLEPGVTAKVLSSNAPDEIVGVAGVTYYFGDGSIGADAGVGYTFEGGAVTLSYDFTHGAVQTAIGSANIESVC